MMFLSLALGRPTARVLLRGIAGYFFLFAPRARRCARQYLRRALGRRPTAVDVFRQVFAFAATILDRLYLARERYELFDITIEDEPLLRSIVTRGAGAFLLGAHLGSFEIMSAIGLIDEGQAGDDPERVREGMSGNICRCGAYRGITEAVLEAQKRLAEEDRRTAA